jgi:D-glycero-alpha-D-manno-heptose 1-phosphate guanylyltransferase
MITEAIILAGGLGTRLRSAVPDLPKCMAPVAGKPFISYLINYYRAQGILKFIFSVGYKHEIIETFLKDEYPDLNYFCSVETEPLGTGGAVLKACSQVGSTNVVVLNGDTFFEVDLQHLSRVHEQNKADCTLSLKPMSNSDRYGVVETNNEGQIILFREKNWYEKSLINGGVYALNIPRFLKERLPEKFSFEKDYLEKLYKQRKMYGVVQDGYFIDIGIPEDFTRAQLDLK